MRSLPAWAAFGRHRPRDRQSAGGHLGLRGAPAARAACPNRTSASSCARARTKSSASIASSASCSTTRARGAGSAAPDEPRDLAPRGRRSRQARRAAKGPARRHHRAPLRRQPQRCAARENDLTAARAQPAPQRSRRRERRWLDPDRGGRDERTRCVFAISDSGGGHPGRRCWTSCSTPSSPASRRQRHGTRPRRVAGYRDRGSAAAFARKTAPPGGACFEVRLPTGALSTRLGTKLAQCRMTPELEAKLDNLPAAPGVYVFKDKATACSTWARPQPEEPRAQLLPGRHRATRASSSTPRRGIWRPRDVVARHREGSRAAREHADQGAPAPLQRQAARRQGVPVAAPRLQRRPGRGSRWCARPKKDGARYFGPYHSATSARQTLRMVNRHFQLRTCTDHDFASRVRPCLQYQIKRCPGRACTR